MNRWAPVWALALALTWPGWRVAAAQTATYDMATNVLTLPAVRVGATVFGNVTLLNTGNYTFSLQGATELVPAPAGVTNLYDGQTGIVTLPVVRVGNTQYLDVRLRNIGNFIFTLQSATEKPPVATGYWLWGSAGALVQGTVAIGGQSQPISSAALIVVNPSAPTTPVTIEQPGQWLQVVSAVQTAVTGAAMTSVNPRHLVYAKGDRLYKLDLRPAAGPPASSLLSSVRTSQLCGLRPNAGLIPAVHGADNVNADRTTLVFKTPGVDGTCSTPDDGYVAIRLDMDGGSAPRTVNVEPLRALAGWDDGGSLRGFVVRSGNQVTRVDAEFGNPVPLFAAGGAVRFVGDSMVMAAEPLAYFVEGGHVRAIRPLAGSTPVTVFDLTPDDLEVSQLSDLTGSYFNVLGGSRSRLVRVTESLAVTTLATLEATTFSLAGTTPTRVVFQQGQNAFSVSKAGGEVSEVCSRVISLHVSGENAWCGSLEPGTGARGTTVVGADGSNSQSLAGTIVVGVHGPNPSLPSSQVGHYALLTMEQFTAESFNTLSRPLMRAWDGAARTPLVSYGTIPLSGLSTVSGGSGGGLWGQSDLFTAHALRDFQTRFEVFLYRNDAAGITRVTNALQ